MSGLENLPVWAAVLISACVLIGAVLTFIGCLGLARLPNFYQRIHAPTLGSSFGTIFILLGSVLFFAVVDQKFSLHEILIWFFVSITTPVTLMLLARAALYRDRIEGNNNVPIFREMGPNPEQQ